jgi:hypothetical protein
MKYRDAPIKGWTGIYELDSPSLLPAGLREKNPQGFGMVEAMGAKAKVK